MSQLFQHKNISFRLEKKTKVKQAVINNLTLFYKLLTMPRNQDQESSLHLLRNSEDCLSPRLRHFKDGNNFCDVTLVAEDGLSFPAHKVILAGHSEKLLTILTQFDSAPFCLYLAGVGGRELAAILEFIYAGEARVSQGSLGRLLSAANTLQVRGLMEEAGEGSQRNVVKEEFEMFEKPQPGDKTSFNRQEGTEDLPEEDLADPGSSRQYIEFVENGENIDTDDTELDEENGTDPMKEKHPDKVQFSFLKTGQFSISFIFHISYSIFCRKI